MSTRYWFCSSTQILSERGWFSKSLQPKVGNDRIHEAVRRKVCEKIREKEGDRSVDRALSGPEFVYPEPGTCIKVK